MDCIDVQINSVTVLFYKYITSLSKHPIQTLLSSISKFTLQIRDLPSVEIA